MGRVEAVIIEEVVIVILYALNMNIRILELLSYCGARFYLLARRKLAMNRLVFCAEPLDPAYDWSIKPQSRRSAMAL